MDIRYRQCPGQRQIGGTISVVESGYLKYKGKNPYGEVDMEAKDLFDAGNLHGAIEQATQDVKANPRDLKSRIFLFELLCFAGELQRAERQLDAIAQTSGDVKVEIGAQIYRGVLQAETARRRLFAGENRTPKFFSEPPGYTPLHIDATAKLRENNFEELEKLLKESGHIRNPVKGQKEGNPFDDFHDGDDVLSPFLEVFLQSDYYWLPFEQIARLEIKPPHTLRDLLWTSAAIELHDRPLGEVFIPALYYGSHTHSDDLLKLGRMTNWKSVGNEILLGIGQRTFFADEIECPLLEIRKIEFTIFA
jgi:type VI secretion system protein ImpE